MFSDSQAKILVGKYDELFCQWWYFLPMTFLPTKFYADFFSSSKVPIEFPVSSELKQRQVLKDRKIKQSLKRFKSPE